MKIFLVETLLNLVNQGYYTVVRTYEFYLRMEKKTSFEDKLHMFKPTCNFLFIT